MVDDGRAALVLQGFMPMEPSEALRLHAAAPDRRHVHLVSEPPRPSAGVTVLPDHSPPRDSDRTFLMQQFCSESDCNLQSAAQESMNKEPFPFPHDEVISLPILLADNNRIATALDFYYRTATNRFTN